MKQGKINSIWLVLGLVLVAYLLLAGKIPGLEKGASGQPINVQVTSTKNTATDTTVTVGPIFDELNPTISASGVQHYVIVNDNKGAKKNLSDSSTFTAKPGDTIQVYYGIESSTYYTRQGNKFTIPDTGALNTIDYDGGKGLYNRMELADFSTSVWTSTGDKMLVEANQSINPGETVDVDFLIKSTSNKEAFSPYKDALIVCLYNGTAINDLYVTVGGKTLEKYSGDVKHVKTGVVATQTDKYIGVIGRLIPGQSDRFEGTVYITADSANGGGAEIVNCTLVDAEWYQDSDTGNFILGYENTAKEDIGISDYSFNIYLT